MSLEFNNLDKREDFNKKECRWEDCQTHDHEFLGSTELNKCGYRKHDHRFAAVTSEVILSKCGRHKHAFLVNTNFVENHHHEIGGETGLSIDVGCGKHIHFVESITTRDEEHCHDFKFATLVE